MKQKRKEKDMINYYEWFEFLQFLENGQKIGSLKTYLLLF